jgi:hypothetical protein
MRKLSTKKRNLNHSLSNSNHSIANSSIIYTPGKKANIPRLEEAMHEKSPVSFLPASIIEIIAIQETQPKKQ